MGIKLKGESSTQVCMNSFPRNNQSEQGNAEAYSLILLPTLPSFSLRSLFLVLRTVHRMWMAKNITPSPSCHSPENLGQLSVLFQLTTSSVYLTRSWSLALQSRFCYFPVWGWVGSCRVGYSLGYLI